MNTWCRSTPGVLRMAACLAAITALSGCAGYIPGAKAHWDAKVKEMCQKDGGVTVYDRVRVSKADIDLLGTVGGRIGIPNRRVAKPNTPVYSELEVTDLRKWNPRVSRSEESIIRRSDHATVARSVIYSRSGGDFPTGFSEATSFACPTPNEVRSALQELFIVEKETK